VDHAQFWKSPKMCLEPTTESIWSPVREKQEYDPIDFFFLCLCACCPPRFTRFSEMCSPMHEKQVYDPIVSREKGDSQKLVCLVCCVPTPLFKNAKTVTAPIQSVAQCVIVNDVLMSTLRRRREKLHSLLSLSWTELDRHESWIGSQWLVPITLVRRELLRWEACWG